MTQTVLAPEILRGLRASLHDTLISPGDDNYEAARNVWNGRFDKYPALIVRCAETVDVVTAVQFSRDQHLLTAVRSGGHSMSASASVMAAWSSISPA